MLGATNDDPRAAERLRERLVTSAGFGWARGTAWTRGIGRAMVVVTVGTAYAVTRPPAVDPVVDVSIIGWFSDTRELRRLSRRGSFDSRAGSP